MSIGNNRDYKTRDRNARRNMAVFNARVAELRAQNVAEPETVASYEMRNGDLNNRLKSWVDPIRAHSRLMHFLNHLELGELYVSYTNTGSGWTWTVEGYADNRPRPQDWTSYKTKTALLEAINNSPCRNFKRFQK